MIGDVENGAIFEHLAQAEQAIGKPVHTIESAAIGIRNNDGFNVHQGAVTHGELMNAGQAEFLTSFAEGAVDGHVGAFLAKAEFFQCRSENHGRGRARIDRQIASFSVCDDRQPVGVLMQNELGAAISMCHDILIEGRERDRSPRARREERQGKKEDGNKGQSSHKGMEIIGASGAVNHQEGGLHPFGGTLLPHVLIPPPFFVRRSGKA